MKATFYLSFILLLSQKLFAQTDPITQIHGARNQGIGNIRVFDNSAWSHFNNPANLPIENQTQIAVGYDHRFGLAELSTVNFAASIPFGPGSFGFGIARFGGKLFNQQSIGISYSNRIGIASIGGKLEWFQTQIEGFGTGNAAIFSIGGIVELGPTLSLGATISNLNRARIGKNATQRLPTGVSLGLTYQPIPPLIFFTEVEKDILISPVYKVGLEYSLRDWLDLRTGINSNPGRLFYGFGLAYEKFKLDIGFGQMNPIGNTSHVSISMDLDK